MDMLVGFFLLFALGVVIIVSALWDYRTKEEKKRRDLGAWKRATSTTMTSGKTGHVIITYTREDGE